MSTESKEFEGKNLDVAVWKASQELEIAIEKLRYEILDKGRRGQGEDPGQPARIRILTAEEAEAKVKATPAQEEPRRERPPRRESRPASREPRREPRSRRDEEVKEDHDAEDAAEEDEPTSGADDAVEDAADERVAEADEGRADTSDERTDEGGADASDEQTDEEDEDLEEPPSASSALLEDDDPIEIAREARRHSMRARQEPVQEAREPRREHSPRRRPARAEDERAAEASEDEGPAEDEPMREERAPRRERPSRRGESRRPEGALDPDDLDTGMQKAREILPQLLTQMGFDLEMKAEIQEDHIYVPLQGEDCKFLLEHRAEGLNALQFLLNKMVYRGGPTRILVDADGYRKERQEELVERARAVADEVRDSGNSRSLGSLNPFERRLVHMALRDDEDVRTLSRGEGFLKRMEITPKNGDEGDDRSGSERGGRGRRRERY